MSKLGDDFNWNEPNSVIVRHQPAIAVYLNDDDEVVIRQQGHYGPDEDQWIYIAKENVQKVVQAILANAGIVDGAIAPPPRDRTAAERQRRYRERHRNSVTPVTDNATEEQQLRLVAAE